jgi:DNA primase
MGALVEEVKAKVNIVDLIGRYVALKPAGKSYKGRCPFHPDNTPSLVVSPEKGLWHCFGCGAGGDAIGFIMRVERLSFPEALGRLAQEVGIEVRGVEEGRRPLLSAVAAAAEYFSRALLSPAGQGAREYLLGRGIGEEEWRRFGLGYASNRWDGLALALGALGVEVLVEAGLVVAGERGYYDRFRDRVMFSIRDERGRPVAFAGRALSGEPKYLNVPNTPLFTKGSLLFGLDLAREVIRNRGAVLVEGYTDVIAFHSAGIEEAVGSMGTALTTDQARLLARHTDRVVIAYDRDAAGQTSALRGMVILRGAGLAVEVAQLPPGEDPDSLVRRQGGEAARATVAEARPFHRFFLEALAERYDLQSVEGKEGALAEAQALWPEIQSVPLRQELALGLAELLSLPEEEVRATLRGKRRPALGEERKGASQEELLLFFLLEGKLPPQVIADLAVEDFRPEYQPIVQRWLKLHSEGKTPEASALISGLDPSAAAQVAKIALLPVSFCDEQRAVEDVLRRFIYFPRLEAALRELRERIDRAAAAGDGAEVARLSTEYQELCRRRVALLHAGKETAGGSTVGQP